LYAFYKAYLDGAGKRRGESDEQVLRLDRYCLGSHLATAQMKTEFHDRYEAGQYLAEHLTRYANQPDLILLALPRGGVPVAAQVARRLNAPLDVFTVRKLGFPGRSELAMGAIASGGVRVFNRDVMNSSAIPDDVVEEVTAREFDELKRRERLYRGEQPAPEVEGKTVIVVDDGIATGSTMMAAISALRQLGARSIVVATPVIAQSTQDILAGEADEVVAVLAPLEFFGVGQWYEDFSQTSDEEVQALLAAINQRLASAAS
jgi:putative phosphoribosyl transferase